jgi:acetyl esterase/lipase
MRTTLLILCWILALPSALASLLILLPAPTFTLFMVGVGATSWCLWLTLIGIVAGVLGAFAWRSRKSRQAIAGIALSATTVAISIIPTVSAFIVAAHQYVGIYQKHVSLSFGRYLFGTGNQRAVHEEKNILFDTVHALRLDFYSSIAGGGARPAVIVIHGGSWRGGAKSDFPEFDRWLASLDYVVFDIDYRLAGSAARFPAQLEDVRKAISWVRSHASTYHVEPRQIVLLGRSAGGQLALRAAYAPDGPEGVRGVISFYGPTDLVWGYDHPQRPDVVQSREVLENYIGTTPASEDGRKRYEEASPSFVVGQSAGMPPTLFIHGGRDQIVSDHHVDLILPKLKGTGIAEYLYLPMENHAFDVNFNGWGSQLAQARVKEFLDRYVEWQE